MDSERKIKEEILNRELRKHVERKTMLELQISLQKKLDPKEMSAKKPLRTREDGTVLSYETISRGQHIGILEEELENTNLVIQTITEQI